MDYEKLLARAREAYKNCVTGAERRRLESLFPELKESEDERIRKEIIDIIKSQKEQQCHIDGAVFDEMCAWLESLAEDKYSVWVGGAEVNDRHLTKEEARNVARKYKDDGYDDVVIELI